MTNGVVGHHLEVEEAQARVAVVLDHLAHELLGDPLAPRIGHDVEIGDAGCRRAPAPRERETDDASVLLGDERELLVHDLGDLAQLGLDVEVDVLRLGDLALERAPELAELLQIRLGGVPDAHGVRSPSSR